MFNLWLNIEAVSVIFKIDFLPKDADFYELTPEQYQKYQGNAESSQKIYMILSTEYKKQKHDVLVVNETQKLALLRAVKFIEQSCNDSQKVFTSDVEKLRYMASILPSVLSEGTLN